jgi:hypothetical protein
MMHSDLLPVFINNADVDIAIRLPDVLAGRLELRHALEFCGWYRLRGIASFLLSGDAVRMNEALSSSARAFLHWVLRGNEAPAGRAKPFYDAVAAGDADAARELAQSVLGDWRRDSELEDDFLFTRFLMQRFFLGAPASEVSRTITRWETLLDGEPDARFEMCHALLEADADLFDDALRRWLSEVEDDWAGRIEADALLPETLATECRLSVEGIALLRVAAMAGLRLEQNYPMVPDIARPNVAASFDPGAWQRG